MIHNKKGKNFVQIQNERGRSIVELLGVLAIIGVLSVTGVKGYSLAMNKHRANELLHQASMRGVMVVSQLAAGKSGEDLSLAEFTEPTPFGTFGTPSYTNGNDTFSISLMGVDPDVCQQMKATVGSNAPIAIIGECSANALTLCFNTDMSYGISGATGACVNTNSSGSGNSSGGSGSGNGSGTGSGSGTGDNTGGDSGNNSSPECTTSSQCSGQKECVGNVCVCNLSCTENYKVLDEATCTCVYCSTKHFKLVTDVPQSCCELEHDETKGGVNGGWNKQNDGLCHCDNGNPDWSESQQQCVTPAPCPAGSTGINCDPCPAGTYDNNGVCENCPAGTYSAANATACTPCSAGTYSNAGAISCTPCLAGTYSATGASTCAPCSAGTYSGAGASACISCDAGTYSGASATSCLSCNAGTYSAAGASACISCSAGTYSAAGASTCISCAAGTYSAAGAASCTSCPTGKTSPAGSTSVNSCTCEYGEDSNHVCCPTPRPDGPHICENGEWVCTGSEAGGKCIGYGDGHMES